MPIYNPCRQYLRFAFQGMCYKYLVLPYDPSLRMRVFVKCTKTAVGPLKMRHSYCQVHRRLVN